MDLLPYLARGITIGEFIQMNNGEHIVCLMTMLSCVFPCALILQVLDMVHWMGAKRHYCLHFELLSSQCKLSLLRRELCKGACVCVHVCVVVGADSLTASNQGPQLPNLRPNLLQFLRERVLDGREPTPSDREEVVRYFVTRIATGLIQSWVGATRAIGPTYLRGRVATCRDGALTFRGVALTFRGVALTFRGGGPHI